ncbi:unnamed protein product [Bursaphelenchus okinawaensis]|uniref:HD/PDEase domain-containing protein n=1 Tax=Bursaphelenchus okinawaensis TaxID=465554 RepID=A0A811K8E6_9BILA|nr:unnamed protein product [Bursaphelenchus okinawaensis]CAG9095557.1 unnamed protein product [Bursaphelenchus okinawaensis]
MTKRDWDAERPFINISDAVHDNIPIKYPINLLIDTPQFQRLRYLKQLGVVYLVYPTASFGRFEHSLGVYKLSYEFVSRLATHQPELKITGNDKLCVAIAGLLHDLGHGPYSHVYDGSFLNRAYNGQSQFRHEQGSIRMFDFLLAENPEVKAGLDEFLTEQDYIFIKELIDPPSRFVDGKGEWILAGRPREKGFLYDIISNKFDGLDVDKFDYFLRDSRASNVTIRFNKVALERIHNHTKIEKVQNGLFRLCYASKVKQNLSEASDSRVTLHETVYQHKTVIAYEQMLVDMFMAADPYLRFKGTNGKEYKLSQAYEDPKAFMQLTDDHILSMIQHSSDPNLKPAQELYNKILTRKHFRRIGQIKLANKELFKEEKGKLLEFFEGKGINTQDLLVHDATIHRGLGVEKHPIDEIWFYDSKTTVEPTRPRQSEKITNPVAGYVIMYVFSKNLSLTNVLRDMFQSYRENYNTRFEEQHREREASLKRQNHPLTPAEAPDVKRLKASNSAQGIAV